MCEPSTSASVMMMILWYLSFSMLKPQCLAFADAGADARDQVRISWFCSTLSSRAFSTFRILPLIGRIAW